VAWLLPELEIGVEPELNPLEPVELELLEEPEFPVELEPLPEVPVELELPEELEPVDPDEEDPTDVPEVEESVRWAEAGRARATAPAAATLATLTAVVAERTLARPRSLAATARKILSRCALLMCPILRSCTRSAL
jgi:hypothetical protein